MLVKKYIFYICFLKISICKTDKEAKVYTFNISHFEEDFFKGCLCIGDIFNIIQIESSLEERHCDTQGYTCVDIQDDRL